MKIARDLLTLALAVSIATVLLVVIPLPETSYYGSMPPTLSQGPLDDSQDKSLVAVGLLAKKSVMDGPSKEIKPTQPPPTVPEHIVPPAPQMPKVVEKIESDVKASVTKSAEMTGVPPSKPAPPLQCRAQPAHSPDHSHPPPTLQQWQASHLRPRLRLLPLLHHLPLPIPSKRRFPFV